MDSSNIINPIRSVVLALFFLPLLLLSPGQVRAVESGAASETLQSGGSVLIVQSTRRKTDPVEPWSIPQLEERKGMAVLVGNGLLYTDLDLVREAASILVTNPATGMTGTARLRHAGFDSGLGILEVDHPEFMKGLKGFELQEDFPGVGEEVKIGGLSNRREGAVVYQSIRIASRRVDTLDGSDVDRRELIFPVYEPVEGQFTGGPVISNGKLIGIYHSPADPEQGKSYILGADILTHMGYDISDGVYDGYPVVDITYQPVDNPSFRKFVGLEGAEGGLYINRIARDQERKANSVLYPGDVIIKFNGLVVTEGGFVRVKDGDVRTLEDYLATLQSGSVPVEILRMGRIYRDELKIGPAPRYARMRNPIESKRRYFASAGLVFQELDREMVRDPRLTFKPLTREYRYLYALEDGLFDPDKADVVLSSVLDDIATSEYTHFAGGVVRALNGSPVMGLKDFMDRWQAIQTRYIRIDFYDETVPLVLEKERVDEINRRVEIRYRLQLQEDGRER